MFLFLPPPHVYGSKHTENLENLFYPRSGTRGGIGVFGDGYTKGRVPEFIAKVAHAAAVAEVIAVWISQ